MSAGVAVWGLRRVWARLAPADPWVQALSGHGRTKHPARDVVGLMSQLEPTLCAEQAQTALALVSHCAPRDQAVEVARLLLCYGATVRPDGSGEETADQGDFLEGPPGWASRLQTGGFGRHPMHSRALHHRELLVLLLRCGGRLFEPVAGRDPFEVWLDTLGWTPNTETLPLVIDRLLHDPMPAERRERHQAALLDRCQAVSHPFAPPLVARALEAGVSPWANQPGHSGGFRERLKQVPWEGKALHHRETTLEALALAEAQWSAQALEQEWVEAPAAMRSPRVRL